MMYRDQEDQDAEGYPPLGLHVEDCSDRTWELLSSKVLPDGTVVVTYQDVYGREEMHVLTPEGYRRVRRD